MNCPLENERQMTDRGIAKLIEHEGEVLHAYEDSLGFLTIGVGHLIDKRAGGRISQRISRIILQDDMATALLEARQNFAWFEQLDPVRQDAVLNLLHAMGLPKLQGFKNLLGAIDKRDWGLAAYELFNSLWAKQVQKSRVDDLQRALELGHWD